MEHQESINNENNELESELENVITHAADVAEEVVATESGIESDWKLRSGLTEETLSAAIEALIFVSDKPLSINKIRDAVDAEVPLKVLHQAIEKLQVQYETKQHGIRLQEVAMGYQFRTKATYSKILQNYLKISLPTLTPATLEVLAIICYKQPISKTNIDLLRGVDSSHLVKTLLDKKLVTVSGRSEEEIGKPSLFATTSDFLEFFNLSSLDNLPKYHELEELAELDVVRSIPAVKDVLTAAEKQIFDFDDLVEIDEIATKIRDIQTDTEFTKKLKNPVEEIMSEVEGSEGLIKTTKHLSAFDILENFVKDEVATSASQETFELAGETTDVVSERTESTELGLKEIADNELDALLDAAFNKLTDLETEHNINEKNNKVDNDDNQYN